MCRGIEKAVIFRDDIDRKRFTEIVRATVRQTRTTCLAWSLMPNHSHQALQTGPTPISKVMHRINTAYACSFNARHGRVGPLYQGRFRSIPVESEAYLHELIRYIHLNPLRGGLVRNLEELAAYEWSGHAALVSGTDDGILDVAAVAGLFAGQGCTAQAAIREHMLQGWIGGERPIDPEELLNRLRLETRHDRAAPRTPLVVSRSFAAGLMTDIAAAIDARSRRQSLFAAAGWTTESIRALVCRRLRIPTRRVASGARTRSVSRARAVIAWLATEYLGASRAEIARAVGVRHQAVRGCIARGRELEIVVDPRGRLARIYAPASAIVTADGDVEPVSCARAW